MKELRSDGRIDIQMQRLRNFFGEVLRERPVLCVDASHELVDEQSVRQEMVDAIRVARLAHVAGCGSVFFDKERHAARVLANFRHCYKLAAEILEAGLQ